jgi:hypothetical protein
MPAASEADSTDPVPAAGSLPVARARGAVPATPHQPVPGPDTGGHTQPRAFNGPGGCHPGHRLPSQRFPAFTRLPRQNAMS